MRGALALGLALLLTPSASAAAPTVSVQASATSYRWDLGDGTVAEGPVVQHVYAEPGAFTAVATATSASGESAQAGVTVTAYRLAFEAPVRGSWGRRGRFTGSSHRSPARP